MKSIAICVLTCALVLSAYAADSEPQLVLEDLQCRGNEQTPCRFILGYVYVSPGDAVNEEEVQNAKLRLSALPNFSSVSIFLEKGSSRGKARLIVEVVEANHIVKELAVGVTANSSSAAGGQTYRSYGQQISGQWSDLNLFHAGKVLDLTATGWHADSSYGDAANSASSNAYAMAIQYADPHLFDSKRYFLSAAIFYSHVHTNGQYEIPQIDYRATNENSQWSANLAVGRRFWDFSYVVLGSEYRSTTDNSSAIYADGFAADYSRRSTTRAFFAGYGWNSQDDYYFPLHGSSFDIRAYSGRTSGNGYSDSWGLNRVTISYFQNWTTRGATTWTLRAGGSQINGEAPSGISTFESRDYRVGLSFARPWSVGNAGGAISRGRWYVEGGIGDPSAPRTDLAYTLKTGVRLDMPHFAIVDVFFFGGLNR